MARKTYSKPDFIAIGPPKTGTTWLYKNLEAHHEVRMPPDKEIRHFWEKVFTDESSYKERRSSPHWHHVARQIFCQKRLREHKQNFFSGKIDITSLWWDLKYAYGTHTDKWYSSLFDKGLVSGDISAKYCELPDEEVRRIHDHFPNLKIVITLRDPVAREWSRAKMNLCKRTGRAVNEVLKSEYIIEFNDPLQKQSNNYVALIQRWKTYFGEKQVLVLFYDELLQDPLAYFNKLCRFLQISDPDGAHEKRLIDVVFKGVKGDIPSDYEKYLFDLHKDNILNLSEFMADEEYPQNWFKIHAHLM
ncbi:MAG: sulfotransferase family protein [Desulfobulbia bacterium]